VGSFNGYFGYFAGLLIGILGMIFSDASNIPVGQRDLGISLFIRGLTISIISTLLLLYLRYKRNIIKFKTMQRVLVSLFGFTGLATILSWGWISAVSNTALICYFVYFQLEWVENETQKQAIKRK
jgi:uncharacterized membrane protein